MKKDKFSYILLAFILLGAIFLRFLYLDTSLWYDEACSYVTAVASFPIGIMKNLFTIDMQHTPLYFFILHFWMKLFGNSEVVLRVLSLVFGLGTIPLVYTIANKISSKKVAFYSGLIAAVSPVAVIFSVEVRMYVLAMFLVLLSMNFLIDFEQKGDKKSLIKLVLTNISIPYTLVGAIFYNLILLIFYSKYLHQNNKEKLAKYLSFAKIEWGCLIPYFVLIWYYTKLRFSFVIAHEGNLRWFHVVDVVRNFFGSYPQINIYWPGTMPNILDLAYTIFIIVPCVYFVVGFIKGYRTENRFLKLFYQIIFGVFVLAIIFSLLKVNVFTTRYIVYLLLPSFIFSIAGLAKWLNKKHFNAFLILYIICCTFFTFNNAKKFSKSKTLAFKSTAIEADKLGLNYNDVVILPFGSDSAYYYYKNISQPKIIDADFHKIVRNPRGNYYDKNQAKDIITNKKYLLLYNSIHSDSILSQNYFRYFIENVNNYVPSGRYALIAMYDTDANSIVDITDLRNIVKDEYYVKDNFIDVFLQKYMCDIVGMLNLDFKLVKIYKSDNYTYLLFQKK